MMEVPFEGYRFIREGLQRCFLICTCVYPYISTLDMMSDERSYQETLESIAIEIYFDSARHY